MAKEISGRPLLTLDNLADYHITITLTPETYQIKCLNGLLYKLYCITASILHPVWKGDMQ